ncbi:cell division protein ZipA [Spongiibacter nanhainus]|uniref:Cell division protein ZipA n=1 Tax=Spongiibacter nanhainus TaxID=2794344 RepID=A0A7T4QY24_9GAMM|nr:cell division protein ZipA [Spongiibacter nanhainus]QQD16782.1 cell division protein ZipA [Spongiibacter nanhainus]
MDLSVRDWMIIIGVLLAVAVLLDGFRRMRKERGDTIRLAAKRRREAEDELTNPELPGAARVVAVREEPSLHVKHASPRGESEQPPVEPRETDKALSEESATEQVTTEQEPRQQPVSDSLDDDILFQDPEVEYGRRARQDRAVAPDLEDDEGDSRATITASVEDRVGDVEPSTASRTHSQSSRSQTSYGQSSYGQGSTASSNKTGGRSPESTADNGPQELIVLNVMAPDDTPYSGPDVLQVLLACDVRFGRMNIFHRHEKTDGTGAEQFSVANLVEPGYFDLDAMDDFTTPGLLFFMNLPGPEDSVKAFDAMVETARCLVKNLGGELRDQTHSVATKQTLEHYKQRIRDFERRQLTLM